jgi:hypothetical protein
MDTRGEEKMKTSKKNVDGRSTSSHDNKKYITKNIKLYIYQTIIQNILMYGTAVWQIATGEINKIVSIVMDVLTFRNLASNI